MKAWMWGAIAAFVAAFVTVVGINVVRSVNPEEPPAHGRTSQDSQSRNDAYLRYVQMYGVDDVTTQMYLDAGYFVCKQRGLGKGDTTIGYNLIYTFPDTWQRIIDGADQHLC